MRKIVFSLHGGYAGTDVWEFYEVSDTVSDAELDKFAWELAKDNAEMYGIYPREEYCDSEDYSEDDDSYSDNIEGWWELYDAKKHNGLSLTGSPNWIQY